MGWRRALPTLTLVLALGYAGAASATGPSIRAYDETAGVRDVLAFLSIAVPPSSVDGSAATSADGDAATSADGNVATAAQQRQSSAVRLASASAPIPFEGRDLGYLAAAAVVLGLCGVALVGGDFVRQWRGDPDRYDSL